MIEVLSTIRYKSTPKTDGVALFMQDLAQYYQLPPDKRFIFLPFARRRHVFEMYQDQAVKMLKCTQTFFLSIWRKNALCKHIKLRKHLLCALCDDCVEFRELARLHHTHVEREALKRAELAHKAFVMDER